MLTKAINKYRVPAFTGFALLILFAVFSAFMLVDAVEVGGINRWIKPMKFAISVSIYLLTLVVYFALIEGAEKEKSIIGTGSSALLGAEILLIAIQAVRGVRSHFNIETPVDGAIFAAMGIMIFISTALLVYLLIVLYRAELRVAPAIAWGLRIGVMITIAASVEGAFMSQNLAHSIGVADGGAGLPFLNWSTVGGDLRIAHFVGLHGMQVIPVFALFAVRMKLPKPVALTVLFAALYFAIFTAAFVQALLGKSLFSVSA